MTRDEHRAACIKASATRVKKMRLAAQPGMDKIAIALNCEPTGRELDEAAMWFDSINGIAWVVSGPFSSSIIVEVLDAHDLTNPPEKKP